MNIKPIICIDAGHGGKDSGALGPDGLRECDVALAVAMLLGSMLVPVATVVYTRKTDEFIELTRRATISNDAGADAFISIHCNSGEPGSGDGFEVYTSPGETASDKLAVDLFKAFGTAFPWKRKRMDLSDGDEDKEARFAVLTRTHARAALFELEFIHTAEGEAWLGSQSNQLACARALAEGIKAHFGLDGGADAAAEVSDREILKGLLQGKVVELQRLLEKL